MDNAPVVEVDADLADLIPQYLENRWADLRFARQLLAKRDFPMLSRLAHRVRGSAASYGFKGLEAVIEVLEAAARDKDFNTAKAQLDAYEAYLRAVRIEYV